MALACHLKRACTEGMELSDFELISPLDITGKGVLWRAEAPDGAPLVVRFFPRPLAPVVADRVEALLRLQGSVGSEYLANVRSVVTQDTRVAVVTDYLAAPTLQASLSSDHVLSFNRRVQVARQVALAIACLHEGGLAHSDISPANIVVGPDSAFLIDLLDTDGYTPGYVAPERLEAIEAGEELDFATARAADWWSWGAVCHQMGIEVAVAEQCLATLDRRPSAEQILRWCAEVDQRLPAQAPQLRLDDVLRTGALSPATVHHRQGGRRRRPRGGRTKSVRLLPLVGAAASALAAVAVAVVWLSPAAQSSASAMEQAGASSAEKGLETSAPGLAGLSQESSVASVQGTSVATRQQPDSGAMAVSSVCPSSADAEAILRQLSQQRHRALEGRDETMLASIYSTANSAAYLADQQLVAALRDADIEVSGLSTQIGKVQVDCGQVVRVTFETREGTYQRCQAGQCVSQPAGESQCVQMTLEAGPWKIAEIGSGECTQ